MAVGTASQYQNQIPQLWANDLYAQAENQTYWQRFEGPVGSTMPIIRRDDLTKEAGDTIKVDIVLALTGSGVSGDLSSLEGNEEALKFRQTSMGIYDIAHAVAWTEKAQVLSKHEKRPVALFQMRKWLAGRIDDDIFAELTGNVKPSTGAVGTTIPNANIWAAGTATSRATVADTDTGGRLKLNTLLEMKAYATTELKIEPIQIENGEELFIFVAHPYTIMQLKEFDSNWTSAQQYAADRGSTNPLFTGAAGMWDNILIHRATRVPRSTNGSIQVSDNVFFGAQALSRGYAMYPTWVEETFDYARRSGVATKAIKGEKLNVFDLTAAGGAAASALTAIGSMVVYASAVAPSQP
jgi:N4-gp56 family major capsid protein